MIRSLGHPVSAALRTVQIYLLPTISPARLLTPAATAIDAVFPSVFGVYQTPFCAPSRKAFAWLSNSCEFRILSCTILTSTHYFAHIEPHSLDGLTTFLSLLGTFVSFPALLGLGIADSEMGGQPMIDDLPWLPIPSRTSRSKWQANNSILCYSSLEHGPLCKHVPSS